MAGWVKFEKDLQTDPRVLRMARSLAAAFELCNAGALHPVTLVSGGLIRLWCYADSHAREDDTLDVSVEELDEIIGIRGFCALMPADWLEVVDDKTLRLPNFHSHNGVEAKRRAQTAKRVEAHRKRRSVTGGNADALPDQTRPDQTQTRPRSLRSSSQGLLTPLPPVGGTGESEEPEGSAREEAASKAAGARASLRALADRMRVAP